MRERLKSDIPRLLVLLPAAFLLWYLCSSAWLLIAYDWDAVNHPFSLDYGEGPILDQVVRLARLQNIYQPLQAAGPYTVSNYPPLYHLVQLPFAWLFGPAYWYGRAISSLCILVTAVFIGLTLYTITKDRLASLTGGLTLLAIPYIVSWSPLCRVDSLALGLSWAGLFVLVRWPENRRALVLSAILLAAAIFTRQSYLLAAPLAAFVWLSRGVRPSQALKLAAWVAGLCLGLFLVMTLLTHGGFYFNIVTANINLFEWHKVWLKARDTLILMPYLVVSAVVFILLAGRFNVKGYWLATPYILASAASAVTIGKAGSGVNYLFEFSAALSFMAGTIVAAPERRRWLKSLLLVLLMAQAAFLANYTRQKSHDYPVYRPAYRDSSSLLMSEIKKTTGPVLADEHMGLLPLSGRNLYYQPFEFVQLSEAGLWDETPLVDDIRKKKFTLIMIHSRSSDIVHERWTDKQLEAIKANYFPAEKRFDTVIYKPL